MFAEGGSSGTAKQLIIYTALKIAEVDVKVFWYKDLGRLRKLGVEGSKVRTHP